MEDQATAQQTDQTIEQRLLGAIEGWTSTAAAMELVDAASRTHASNTLNELVARGLFEKRQNGAASEYRRLKIRDWRKPRVWEEGDGPYPGVFADAPPGHQCAWSCAWITPRGIVSPKAPGPEMDRTKAWYELRDIANRFPGLSRARDVCLRSAGPGEYGQGDWALALGAIQHARNELYGAHPFLSPDCIVRTGSSLHPLSLDVGGLHLYIGAGFRAGSGVPDIVARCLLQFHETRTGNNVVITEAQRLNETETALLAGMRKELLALEISLDGRG